MSKSRIKVKCTVKNVATQQLITVVIVGGGKKSIYQESKVFGRLTPQGKLVLDAIDSGLPQFILSSGTYEFVDIEDRRVKPPPTRLTNPIKVVSSYIDYSVPEDQQCRWDNCYDKAYYDGYCLDHYRQSRQC